MGKVAGLMLTWRIWQMLQIPFFSHPVYERFLHQRQHALRITDLIPVPRVLRGRVPWGFLAGFALLMFVFAGGWILFLSLLAVIPLIPMTGTLYGLVMAVQIAGIVAREREQGRYNLIAVTPLGVPGLNWSVCSAVYHRNRAITQLRDTVRGLYMVMFVVVALFLCVATLNQFALGEFPLTPIALIEFINGSSFTRNSIIVGVVVSVLYVDFIQSIIVGSLLGMLTPVYTKSAINARGVGLGLYLMTQFLFYALVGLLCLVVLPEVLTQVGVTNVVFLSILQLVLFTISREALITWLWSRLADEIGTDIGELDDIARQNV